MHLPCLEAGVDLGQFGVADGVVYSRSGLTYQAQLLESRGLGTRAPSVDDERSVTVTITDAGRALLATVFPGHLEILRGYFLSPLADGEARVLADILGRVRDHMRAAPPRSASTRRRKAD